MERQAVTKNQKAPARQGHVRRNAAGASSTRLVGLQSAIGNQAMRRLIDSSFIQAKLEVSQPGDPSEEEADRVADTVMRMTDGEAEDEPGKATPVSTDEVQAKLEDEEGRKETVPTEIEIQRVPLAVREDDGEEEESSLPEPKEEKETVATKPIDDAPILRQAKGDDDEETEEKPERLQSQSVNSHTPHVTPSIANNIRSLNGSGSPLPPTTRAFFEPRFGADFSGVRVHTDSRATETAKSLQARAFTVGQNIAFGSGQYAPESQAGRHLLAHELTHVVQQNGGQPEVNSSPNVVQRGPLDPPGSLPPLPPVLSPIELKGHTFFEPPDDLAAYIQARPFTPIWVAVKFGSLMSNEIPIYWDGSGYFSTAPPPDHGGHPMPINHKDFPLITGARPMLAINIEQDLVTGFLGWQTGKSLAKDPDKFFEQHPLSELFGLEGLTTDPPSGGTNELSGGKLVYSMPMSYTTGDFEGEAEVDLKDEKYDFTGEIWVNDVKGIDKPMPIKKEGKKLFGNLTWKFNRSLGAAGKLSGEIIGTFAGGKPDVRGTLNYTRSKPQISGTVTVLITTFDKARDEVISQLGPDAPSKIEPGAPDDRLAITGWGHLDFSFNEWLTGNADVFVHPEGYVTAKGEIVPTAVIPILTGREWEPKAIFDEKISVAIPPLDAGIGSIGVDGSLKIEGYASLGPGTLHDLRVAGLFSTHPDIVNTFELSGIMSTPAVAGLVATAKVSLATQILKGTVSSPIETGVKIIGKLELQLYAEAGVTAGRRKGDDGQPEYFLKGTLTGGAGLRLDINIQFFARVLFWEAHIDVTNRTYLIAGGSVTVDFDYILGKKSKKGDDVLKLDPKFGSFDQDEFAAAVLRGKTAAGDKEFKGKEQAEGELDVEENPDAPPPVEPPDPNAPAPPGPPTGVSKTMSTTFTMENEPHTLKLALTDPPELAMESVLTPLLKKIDQERKELKKDRSLGQAEKDSRIAALNKIEASARGVQAAAERAAKNPAFITPQVPGFYELAELIGEYGDNYDVKELGTALGRVIVDPSKPETVLRKFPGLAANELLKAQVSRIIAAGVDAEDLRKIVDNVRPVKEDAAMDLIGLIEIMIHGSLRWDKVITDLRIGGNKFKGARFVIRYVDEYLDWGEVSFEVKDDPGEQQTGRRWDAWVSGILYQFKSWYVWPDIASRTFLRQIFEDYDKTHVGEEMPLHWVFETSLTKAQIVAKMKAALAGVVADIKAGKQPKIPGYTEDIADFISSRVESIVKVVSP